VIALVIVLVCAATAVFAARRLARQQTPTPRDGGVPVAVLGNSDSHAYHDSLWFPASSGLRGGSNRDVAYQWTEVLAALRSDALDFGPWERHGQGPRLARALGYLGIALRSPRKEDFAFNLATSGARCEHLVSPLGQLRNLRLLLERAPERWARGALIIRIGINDIGTAEVLAQAAAGEAASGDQLVDHCVASIERVVREARATVPGIAVVLVGIADNTNWPPNLAKWTSEREMTGIRRLLDRYDDGLRRIAAATTGAAFLDDRAWFRATFGGRSADGTAQFQERCIGGLRLTHRQGDDLSSTILADGHAGTLLNALWSAEVVAALQRAGLAGIAPISASDVETFVSSLTARSSAWTRCEPIPGTPA
jgi:hypothetical protein